MPCRSSSALGVTIQLQWEEYRQDHKPEERVMVDYSGDRLNVRGGRVQGAFRDGLGSERPGLL